MWGGGHGQGNPSPPGGFSRSSNGSNGNGEPPSEGQVAAAAAHAARMAFANAYDTAAPVAPAAPSSFFDMYGAAAGQPSTQQGDQEDAAMLYAQRARELELFHLQQQIQERQAIENEARNRLLEHAARNQIQEYERSRIEMALMAEMQQRDREARIEAERSRFQAEAEAEAQAQTNANANAILSQHEIDIAAAQNLQKQQIAEYIAKQPNQAPAYDSSSSPQSFHANQDDMSAASELKIASTTIKTESTSVKNDAVEPPPEKERSPKEEPPIKKETPLMLEETLTKEDPPAKKEPPVKKEPPAMKEPAAKKDKSPKKKKTPQKEKVTSKAPLNTPSSSQLDSDKKITPVETKSSAASKKRKNTPSKALGAAATGNKAKKVKRSPGGAVGGRKMSAQLNTSLIKRKLGVPSMDDVVPDITEVQYEYAEALMTEFCKVPFLAEFSRPVSLLHPELVTLYSKIIHHPMDLGHICRAIRRQEYKNTRAIQLDVWRVFSNCIKFHMHPNNRENAIPSFISISTHLRDFFNSLWQEYMMPSDAPKRLPGKGISHVHSTFQKRAEARKERLPQLSGTVLTPKCLQKLASALESFISSGGKVDKLDRDAILGDANSAKGDIATFIESLREVIKTIESKIESSQDYTVLELHSDLKKCYTEDVFEHEILKKMKISQRLDRILGKALSTIHEVSCRGVNQSSIWGCMAAAIWGRESKKKPYWPAIVLGILAPEDQKEDWHESLTDRNEGRLPEKLRADLKVAKRRAELGLKKQSSDIMSYFLVEFMGSHEFIWVKESDIIENFDPEEDVNIASAAGNITKKRRSTAFNTKQMSNAIEEGRWALEEFELQLNNTCGDRSDDEDEYNDAGYTFDILCQSDDEADEMDEDEDEKAHESDTDELNELLASEGLLDFSIEGRKKAKARAVALKKQNALLVKKEKEKEKTKKAKPKVVAKDSTKKLEKQLELEEKREKRELELRRKKRARDHEKLLKELERKAKRKKSNASEKKTNPNEVQNKKGRAEAIAKGFLMRKCIKDASFTGASFQPTSSVEPSGLLGMALAFRAAAGEVRFLDNTGKPFLDNSCDKIDADSPLESSERCKRLQDQIDLIRKEIIKVDAATEQRLALAEDAEKAWAAAQTRILDAEEQVRATYAKKKKKSPKKVESASNKPDVKVEDENGDNQLKHDKDESGEDIPSKDESVEDIPSNSDPVDSTHISED
mmetsp:Transcript_10725/g.23757  ORF Transcript_10725/g.23757 Transcript_10725/m.23757 type:complete len:1209 (-) Transcript_10725:330-3956(-)|eukprot:CAMPEP_0172318032 /NCGR_PEP_ID=MMETSP1058-20130122/33712_1 /TAXON_ID=83371 /ORGANISM="Detonula confervacea, Strain CCMP 353" /LENGTH=1208 /DNA_ID=CAMNT_0013032755 /DNA_START=24 /DNA_END=3650 /DNA_ORIENTATION=+